jgi:hypothetical protein
MLGAKTPSSEDHMQEQMSEQEVHQLIEVADGGGIQTRKGCSALWLPIRYHANLDDQLTAVRRLGSSRSPLALEYLSRLNQEASEYMPAPGAPSETGTRTWHPHAKGDLSTVLYREIPDWYPDDQIRQSESYRDTKRLIEEALHELEASIGSFIPDALAQHGTATDKCHTAGQC